MSALDGTELSAAPAVRSHRVAETLSRARELAIVVVIAAVFIATSIKNPSFAHRGSVQEILTGAGL
ncbi:hypothetical protein, partial [Enterococcus casseliflavus]|uniref:hypothetical protein n=1 Tax=Enterococcus casseliflavus TaxID=37734 RepID=UPI003D0D20CC